MTKINSQREMWRYCEAHVKSTSFSGYLCDLYHPQHAFFILISARCIPIRVTYKNARGNHRSPKCYTRPVYTGRTRSRDLLIHNVQRPGLDFD